MDTSFVINGRFLTHGETGVQRYARNVVRAMDTSLSAGRASLLFPEGAPAPPLRHIKAVATGRLKGHAWEQIHLPLAARGQRLLNLCNTGPAFKRDQIVCIHDTNVFSTPDSYSSAFRTLYKTLQPMLAERSLRIATVSEAAARQVARHLPIQLSRILVLPNGHEHALAWDAAAASLSTDLPVFDGDRPYVLALGSRARHKNMALLFDIAPQLDALGINVVVAGGGNAIFTEERDVATKNVFFCGRVSDDDLAHLMDHALCLAFPSITEGFGLPIVEAMARGCPVVSSDRASMPEVCGDAALLASPFDPGGWIAHIRALAQSDQLGRELADRGRQQSRCFSWTESAEGYLHMLNGSDAGPVRAAPPSSRTPRIAVVFATRGRPDVVAKTVSHFIATQTVKPSSVIVSCVSQEDAGELAAVDGVTVLLGEGGLAAQRNTALKALDAAVDIVAFFDDDFVADPNWLAAAAQAFQDEASIGAFTGVVLADGIKGPGIAFADAVALVETAGTPEPAWLENFSPYGCNMAFRVAAIGDLRFDERLVLYGWLEDRDFGAQIARRGHRLVKSSTALGVHMGVKSGRVNGARLGYSQIANPLYMLGKKTMARREVADHIFRNTASNLVRAFTPEPYVDRKGRVKGNMLAVFDALRGRLAPERAASLELNKPIFTAGRRPVDV